MCRNRLLGLGGLRPWVCLVAAMLTLHATVATSGAKSKRVSGPAGVCFPVQGTGYTISRVDNLRIPLGTLSPLVAGDSLVVLTGSITFVDFRTGESAIYGAGTRLTVATGSRPKPPSWVKRLEDHIMRSLHGPERDRVVGSVRGGECACWPDSARFAPGVPVVLEWAGVAPPPAVLRISTAADTTEVPLGEDEPAQGVWTWKPENPVTPGEVVWDLLDSRGERLGGGRFDVLTPAAAEQERRRFLRLASELFEAEVVGLSSSVLAEADRAYLW